jgi:hypothetical protein
MHGMVYSVVIDFEPFRSGWHGGCSFQPGSTTADFVIPAKAGIQLIEKFLRSRSIPTNVLSAAWAVSIAGFPPARE